MKKNYVLCFFIIIYSSRSLCLIECPPSPFMQILISFMNLFSFLFFFFFDIKVTKEENINVESVTPMEEV